MHWSRSLVVHQVLAIGQRLIKLHQAAHIPQLLALAGEAAHNAGSDFLRVTTLSSCTKYSIGERTVPAPKRNVPVSDGCHTIASHSHTSDIPV